MNIFVLLLYCSFLIYCAFILYLIFDNYTSKLNISCALLVGSFSVWTFGDTFMQNSISIEEVIFWEKISSLGWCGYPIFLLLFVLVFIEKEIIIKKYWMVFIVISLLAVLFIYQQFTKGIIVNHKYYSFGWVYEWADDIWTYLYFLYSIILVAIALFLCFKFSKQTDQPNKKMVGRVIFWCILLGFLIGGITNILLPLLRIYIIPPIACTSLIVFVAHIIYSITRGEFG